MIGAWFVIAALTAVPAAKPPELFALVLGVNRSFEKSAPPLRFADDDAAGYADLFRGLGAKTYLLSRLDDNTRALHPEAAREAREPVRSQWLHAIAQLNAEVAAAKRRGAETDVFFVFAGHGNVKSGVGYISLEDGALTGSDLKHEFTDAVSATRIHVIVDACYSYFLAHRRGPGGTRRPLEGTTALEGLDGDDRVGLLLSTSSARESFEWENFQAGVFHHEVRSGLRGPADVDGDARVTYRELAAFVHRANEAIRNERFRPDLYSRAPKGSETLIDLRGAMTHRLEFEGDRAAHFWIEDANGVRLAEFHSALGTTTRVVRTPEVTGNLYARRAEDGAEWSIPAGNEVWSVTAVPSTPPRVSNRGAAHDSFSQIFSLPFGPSELADYRPNAAESSVTRVEPMPLRRKMGWAALGLGVASSALGGVWTVSAAKLREEATHSPSQKELETINLHIRQRNVTMGVCYGIGAAALLSSALLLLGPDESTDALAELRFTGTGLSFRYGF